MFEMNEISKQRNILYGLSMIWIVLFHCYEYCPKCFSGMSGFFLLAISKGSTGVDVFLFLSGISMYFAMKSTLKKERKVKDFLIRRLSKILNIYLKVCIPAFLLFYITGHMGLSEIIRQIFFVDRRVSMFWYLGCAMICYLIYPFLFRLIENGKEKYIVAGVVVYYIILASIAYFKTDLFYYFEIMWCRFPVFVLGALCGKSVYYKKCMNPYLLLILLLGFFMYGPVKYYAGKFSFYQYEEQLIRRIFQGLQRIGLVFLLTSLASFFEETRIYRWIAKIGTITLEIYVMHIIIRRLNFEILGFIPATTTVVILWSIAILASSIGVAYVLNVILNRKRI